MTLTTFFVQEGIPDNNPGGYREPRVFMDTRLHDGCKLLNEIDAADWASARLQLPANP